MAHQRKYGHIMPGKNYYCLAKVKCVNLFKPVSKREFMIVHRGKKFFN